MNSFAGKSGANERNSSIEFLRVIAMLFIVMSHACVHSNFDISASAINFNKLFVQWGTLGNLGVDIYVLISGYFLCQKKREYRSILRLFLQVWFYSVLLFLFSSIVLNYNYSVKALLGVIFPTIFQEYWFFTTYIILSLLMPYINVVLEKLGKHSLERLICLMAILWIVIPTFTLQTMYGNALLEFIMLYIIGAYFRMYPQNILSTKSRRYCLLIISGFLLFLSTFVLDYLGKKNDMFSGKGIMFFERNSPLIVGIAVGLFTIAIYHKPFYNRFINILGACTFGVYLIHDNPAIRKIIWIDLFHNAEYFSSPLLPIRIIGCMLLVFSVSSLIEYIRISYIEKHLLGISYKLLDKASQLQKIYIFKKYQ